MRKATKLRRMLGGLLPSLTCAILSACEGSLAPERVAVGDPRIASLWVAARRFERARFGFSDLPRTGKVGWERRSGVGYDVMLHLDGRTTRTIAFRRSAQGYGWIGEQETFPGPGVFPTPDGDEREKITLDYEFEPVSGHALNRLNVDYVGGDASASATGLTLSAALARLTTWGYRPEPVAGSDGGG